MGLPASARRPTGTAALLHWSTDIAPFVTTNSAVTIAAGTTVLWDVTSTPSLGSLTINGTLIADWTQNVAMTVTDYTVSAGGSWIIAAKDGFGVFPGTATITVNGARSTHTARPTHPDSGLIQGYTNDGASRAGNNKGTVYFRGVSKRLPKTKLNATAAASATSITLLGDCTDWAIGDSIVVAPTNFYGQSTSERVTITSVGSYSGGNTVIGISPALGEKHWGQLQYPIDATYGNQAMSLTPGTFTAPDAFTPTVYDTRGEVINLSSGNIVIQAPNDSAWSTQGWGVHTMNHPGSTYYYEGVRIIRGGQQGALGRYPFHSHKLSYADQTANITFNQSGANVVVNWTNHGITPATPTLIATVFTNGNTYAGFKLTATVSSSDAAKLSDGQALRFSGTSLPGGISANTTYYLQDPGSLVTNQFYVSTTQSSFPTNTLLFSSAGSSVVTNVTSWSQPVMFSTTVTLPNALSVGAINQSTAQPSGTTYYTVGNTITTGAFEISTSPGALSIPVTGGAGSGTHSGLYTAFTQDRPDCQIIKCVVDTSSNRGFTTHATCGSVVQDCITFDTKGNTYFIEDGSEERNVFIRNFALKVRKPTAQTDSLKDFDFPYSGGPLALLTGSAGHWWANMNNQFIDQTAADCDFAVLNFAGAACFGISALVNITPNYRPILRWLRNGGHSNQFNGLATNTGAYDEFGRTGRQPQDALHGDITTAGYGYQGNLMEGGIAWKNNQGGYQNVLYPLGPFYKGWMTGDNGAGDFQGAMNAATNVATSILMVGQSLNDGPISPITPNDTTGDSGLPYPRFGNATYHFTLPFTNCAYQNFPWVRSYYRGNGQRDYGGGAYAWRDLYTDSTGPQYQNSQNNKFNNSHPGHLTRADRYAGYPCTVSLANPCVVTANIADAGSSTYEFYVQEGEPIRFVRTTGALPSGGGLGSPLVKDKEYFAKNVRLAGGGLAGAGVNGVSCELSLTSGGASLNSSGATQSGSHSAMPMWAQTNKPWRRGMGSTLPDLYQAYGAGSTGTSARWVCPYGDNPFFTTGARNTFNTDPGTPALDGWGFSTTDFFCGLQYYFNNNTGTNRASYGYDIGLNIIRRVPTTLAYIGQYDIDNVPATTVSPGYFPQFQHGPLLNIRGSQTWYDINPGNFPDGTAFTAPTTSAGLCIVGGQDPAADMVFAISYNNASVGTAYRTLGNSSVVPSGPSGVTGEFVTLTSTTSIALVASDATGSKYFNDTANKKVYVRHLPLPGSAAHTASQAALLVSNSQKQWDPSWIMLSTP